MRKYYRFHRPKTRSFEWTHLLCEIIFILFSDSNTFTPLIFCHIIYSTHKIQKHRHTFTQTNDILWYLSVFVLYVASIVSEKIYSIDQDEKSTIEGFPTNWTWTWKILTRSYSFTGRRMSVLAIVDYFLILSIHIHTHTHRSHLKMQCLLSTRLFFWVQTLFHWWYQANKSPIGWFTIDWFVQLLNAIPCRWRAFPVFFIEIRLLCRYFHCANGHLMWWRIQIFFLRQECRSVR